MSEKLTNVTVDGTIATITLNRAKKRNALNGEIMSSLDESLYEVEHNMDIRGVIITGDGVGFSAGVDFGFLAGGSAGGGSGANSLKMLPFRTGVRRLQAVFNHIEAIEKPVVAAIEGFAIGMGLELALAADFRVAGESAQISIPEVAVGLVPDVGGTTRLIRTVGLQKAKRMILTARTYTAKQMLDMDVVDEVVPDGQALAKAREMLDEICQNAPLAVGLAKKIIDRGASMDKMTLMELEVIAQSILLNTKDVFEGMSARMQKRKPNFKGQ